MFEMYEVNIPSEILKYENYVNETLKPNLSEICSKLDQVNADLAEYEQLIKTIQLMKEFKDTDQVYKTMMDIGCNYFMEARVEDLSHILLDIGSGCYLEFSLDEAVKFIENRTDFLKKKQKLLRKKSAETKAHVKLMLLCMNKICGTEDKEERN